MPLSCAMGTKPLDCTTALDPGWLNLSVFRQASNTTKCVALRATALSLRVIFVRRSDSSKTRPSPSSHLDGDKVVGAPVGGATTGIVEEPDGARAGSPYAPRAGVNCTRERAKASVLHNGNLEVETLEYPFE